MINRELSLKFEQLLQTKTLKELNDLCDEILTYPNYPSQLGEILYRIRDDRYTTAVLKEKYNVIL